MIPNELTCHIAYRKTHTKNNSNRSFYNWDQTWLHNVHLWECDHCIQFWFSIVVVNAYKMKCATDSAKCQHNIKATFKMDRLNTTITLNRWNLVFHHSQKLNKKKRPSKCQLFPKLVSNQVDQATLHNCLQTPEVMFADRHALYIQTMTLVRAIVSWNNKLGVCMPLSGSYFGVKGAMGKLVLP